MSLFRAIFGCRHDWEYSTEHYDKNMTRTCKKCGLKEDWHEWHMGEWRPK